MCSFLLKLCSFCQIPANFFGRHGQVYKKKNLNGKAQAAKELKQFSGQNQYSYTNYDGMLLAEGKDQKIKATKTLN
jgi:hypothetical protein